MEKRRAYPTDLTERQWEAASRLIPQPKPGGRPAKYPRRAIADAVAYAASTRCAWRSLPTDFPPWHLVYRHQAQWKREGIYARFLETLTDAERV